jgi:hypothetical protein
MFHHEHVLEAETIRLLHVFDEAGVALAVLDPDAALGAGAPEQSKLHDPDPWTRFLARKIGKAIAAREDHDGQISRAGLSAIGEKAGEKNFSRPYSSFLINGPGSTTGATGQVSAYPKPAPRTQKQKNGGPGEILFPRSPIADTPAQLCGPAPM